MTDSTSDHDIDVGIPAASPVPSLPEPPCLVGSPAEGQLRGFLAIYSQRDWARDQDQEPLGRTHMKYLRLNCPTPFPAEVLTPVGTLPAPSASEVL